MMNEVVNVYVQLKDGSWVMVFENMDKESALKLQSESNQKVMLGE